MTGLRWSEQKLAQHLATRKATQPGDHTQAVKLTEMLTADVSLFLAFPPTVNHSTKPTSSGGRILTEAHREFREHVARVVIAAGSPRVDGRLAIRVVLCADDKRAYDLDNRAKALLDALQRAGVYADDNQVDELTLVRGPIVELAYCVVIVWRIA